MVCTSLTRRLAVALVVCARATADEIARAPARAVPSGDHPARPVATPLLTPLSSSHLQVNFFAVTENPSDRDRQTQRGTSAAPEGVSDTACRGRVRYGCRPDLPAVARLDVGATHPPPSRPRARAPARPPARGAHASTPSHI